MIDQVRGALRKIRSPVLRFVIAVLLVPGQAAIGLADADDRSGIARQQHNEARGWLQLERDQAVYRDQVAPLSPSAQRGLETRERMEANDKRALDLRQRQDIQNQARKDRLSKGSGDLRPGTRSDQIRLRQSDQQRLRMRMNRDIRR